MEQNDNKYAPPNSRVADPESINPAEMPREVRISIWLLSIAIMGGIINQSILNFISREYPRQNVISAMFIIPIGLGFCYMVYRFFSGGKNWARIFFLVSLVLGLVATPFNLEKMFNGSFEKIIVYIVQCLLDAAAMWLVFTHPGREWFRRNKN